MSGIYKITSPTGRVYIGKTALPFFKRFRDYYLLHCRAQTKLFRSLTKYGPSAHAFEIVEHLSGPLALNYLDAFEQAIYYEYVVAGYSMLNAVTPGSHEFIKSKTIKRRLSPEHRLQLSLAHKGPRPWRVGTKMSEQARAKMRASKLKYYSNQSNLQRQQQFLQQLRTKLPARHSEATKRKMSESHKRRHALFTA